MAAHRTTAVCTIVGGVISPVLSNLFMHYAFDVWMTHTHPDLPWCRYADDGVVHCRTERDALALRAALAARLEECGLQMHPDKTRIVYCKDGSRTGRYPRTQFDFLGYTFGAVGTDVGIDCGAFSSGVKVSAQAARSIGGSAGFSASVGQPSTFLMVIWPEARRAQNSMAAVSAEGRTVWVLIRRLNSSCRRSIALVVRADFHWLGGSRVKVNSRSPASSRLSATARHLSRHLRRKALRRSAISVGVAA